MNRQDGGAAHPQPTPSPGTGRPRFEPEIPLSHRSVALYNLSQHMNSTPHQIPSHDPLPRLPATPHRVGWLAPLRIILGLIAVSGQVGAADPEPGTEAGRVFPAQAWGTITQPAHSRGLIQLEVKAWPAGSRIELPTPFPNITAARLVNGREKIALRWLFNPDATRVTLEVPARPPARLPLVIQLETADKTTQHPDGRIVFSALDATVQGTQARLETNPGNHRIGFWTDPSDSVTWNYKPSRWGMYDVELTYSGDGGEGTQIEVTVGGQKRSAARESTGSWYRYGVMPLGRVYLASSDPLVVRAGCLSMKGGAALNLKAVTLRPAPEGNPITQSPSGEVVLAARDAITHSILMRYEPATNKNCLGFWANPADWAEWEFSVTKPGTYEVEVWQGCGKGQGGSEVAVEVDDARLSMTVLETGHFQIFIPRRVGQVVLASAGSHTLAIRPVRKRAGAVMDVRQVRLVPVDPHAPAPRARRAGHGPVDVAGRPLIQKLGTVDLDLVETTPVVIKGRLWRFEWVRAEYWDNRRKTNYFRFRDPVNGEVSAPFADGHEFGSAFVEGDKVYVTGTLGRNQVDLFVSQDLKTWETWTVIPAGRYGIFNTSLCKAARDYVLMFEIDRPVEEAGVAFTARFARSTDLHTWTVTPPECNYARDRYTAPHCLRWQDGWFYDFYLEAHQGYEMRVVRSRDLILWEPSPLNPVLRASPEDKLIANPKLTDSQRSRVAHAADLNNSDLDFCEWHGRLMINYSWGNQLGVEHLGSAIYEGTQAQFLRGWFPGD